MAIHEEPLDDLGTGRTGRKEGKEERNEARNGFGRLGEQSMVAVVAAREVIVYLVREWQSYGIGDVHCV